MVVICCELWRGIRVKRACLQFQKGFAGPAGCSFVAMLAGSRTIEKGIADKIAS